MQETQVWSLSWEDPLEKGTATHSSILAWRIPWTEESGGVYSPWGRKKSDTTEQLTHTPTGHTGSRLSVQKNMPVPREKFWVHQDSPDSYLGYQRELESHRERWLLVVLQSERYTKKQKAVFSQWSIPNHDPLPQNHPQEQSLIG